MINENRMSLEAARNTIRVEIRIQGGNKTLD